MELSAFRLECFDYAREYLKQFQAYGGSKIAEYRQDADRKIAEIKLGATCNKLANLFTKLWAINPVT